MVFKNSKIGSRSGKVWIDEGIINIQIGREVDIKTLKGIVDNCKERAKKISNKPKILIDITFSANVSTTTFRKESVLVLKNFYNDIQFEKMAVYGGSAFRKVIATFIIKATGLKNIKYSKTKEEALKWLKES